MTTPQPHPPIGGLSPTAFSSLFQAINGLRNLRALVAMLGCMVIGVLVAGLFSLLAAPLGYGMAVLGALALFIASAAGVNAAGVLLMDQAQGLPSRPLAGAVVYGLMCIPKFIGLALLLCAAAILVFVALALVYLVCKIPVLGPMLFVAVFPLSVVLLGLTLCGLALCMLLALPAIWEGAPIVRALAQAWEIARSRLVESILLLIVVGLLTMVVGLIVCGLMFVGLMPAIGLSNAVLGGEGLGSLVSLVRSGGELSSSAGGGVAVGGAGYALAAGMGAGLLWSLVGSLLSLVYLLGLNLVYLRVTEGLDISATEAALQAHLASAKRQASDLGQRAKEAADRAREQARQAASAAQASASAAMMPSSPPPAPPPAGIEPTALDARTPRALPPGSTTPAVAKALNCPQCLSAVAQDDVYCAVCGHRLK